MDTYIPPLRSREQREADAQEEREGRFFEQLRKRIQRGLAQVQQEGKALAILYWSPSAGQLNVFSISTDAPDLISIHGTDANDTEWAILTHVSMVQLAMQIVDVNSAAPPPRQFGFTPIVKPLGDE